MKFLNKSAFTLSAIFLMALSCLAQNDIKIIKERIGADLMETKIEDAKVESLMANMNEDGSFKAINYSDLSRNASFPHGGHTRDMVYMAKAYKNKTSKFYQSKPLKAQIEKGLLYWVEHDFVGDNWHDNQITTPTNLGNLMLVIGDELPKELVARAQPMIGRANMNASGARPSGDRIVIAGILAKNLLFQGDYKEFDKIIKIIEGELKFATGERGMQHDYSFHHRVDRVNNTSSYGYGKYANAYGEWSYYVSGTPYAFSKEKINQLVDYYLDGIYKQMVYGVYEDISVKNRSISNPSNFQPFGTLEIERVLISTDYRKKELEEIIRLRKGEAKPSASFAKFFWQSEHFVFQRPNFYTTVRMFSTRNRNMEEPYNGPGKLTHHRADGTNYLMLKGDEYLNIWPAYDWQKISGTTIVQKPALPGPDDIQKAGLTDFVGAVTDGLYGAVVFDFKSPHDPLKAKKSWFFFDEEYVCLGTDIKSESDMEVATTLNQVLMRTDVHMLQGGNLQVVANGSRVLQNVKWVHHDKIGYIFPDPATVNLSNQTETGSWAAITDQKNISKEPVNRGIFKLWFNHGSKPDKASYQYIVVPDISEKDLVTTSKNNRFVEILSNTSSLQAVRQSKLGITQLAFYQPGNLQIEKGLNVRLASSGIIMLKTNAGKLKTLTLADPSRKLGSMELSVSGIYKAEGEGYKTVVNQKQNTTTFIVDLPQGVYLGKSVSLSVK
ncbi:polysaccharide lyase family 8 super-sandwich domain-containing protein [Dyadobacter psychrotolerans]|uniref:Chondroitin lyase n=1 Tax=Dyadobacter psychrotolerans TaxID=2541721 RepID=A0A4R5DMS3_9BACT|nr:polysaccharide lyase family 8 super-sandwich domain-containing protein [Dyadobacter psychrotolerans]TDE15592.1 chondroitin lyase [Dyadobacter psychrotolerans]